MKIFVLTPIYATTTTMQGATPVVHYFAREWVKMGHVVTDHVLTLPMEQLQEKGKEARQWVLRNKNNYLQAKRIIDLLGK